MWRCEPKIKHLQCLAALLPTGIEDPRALEKMIREKEELQEKIAEGDTLGAILEAADVAYYAAKAVAKENKLLSYEEAASEIEQAARSVNLTVEKILHAAETKYTLRARPGNPKNDEEERQAVARELRI